MALSSTSLLGSRLLREIAIEEGTLEEFLKNLRTTHTSNPSRTGISSLDSLWKTHGGPLAITGRGMPLLYHLLDHMVTMLHGTVALIDIDGRFSPSHLSCDLQHIHVFKPGKSNLQATMESVEGYMLWGKHVSKGREWVGTLVNGGAGQGVDICVGWRGWLRVEREEVTGFAVGVSVEEAIEERERRQEVVDGKGWRAVSDLGIYCWK